MKRTIFYKILIVTALFAGCKKIDLPPPVTEDPVFSASMILDGTQKGWEAGVDSIYMFSEFEKDDLDVHVFTGRFQQQDCPACLESFSISIRDFQALPLGNPAVGEALAAGDYGYASAGGDTTWVVTPILGYQVLFDASGSTYDPATVSPPLFYWQFENVNVEIGSTASRNYAALTPAPLVELRLVIAGNFLDSCVSTQTQRIQEAPGLPCSVAIAVSDSIPGLVSLNAEAFGAAPFSFAWSNGDSSSGILVQPFPNTGYSVSLTDANGCVANASLSAMSNPGVNTSFCTARFTYEVAFDTVGFDSIPVVNSDPLQLSKILIRYVSPNGIEFRSDLAQQPSQAFFEIISVEDYDPNEQGQQTKKVWVKFACNLGNSVNSEIRTIQEGTAVIAVAYP